ncbi:hypothetical protein KY284_026279 [Solanum tuberosum]|nr:hypothetical protein KY284_026279 [Solanum tuberosum]
MSSKSQNLSQLSLPTPDPPPSAPIPDRCHTTIADRRHATFAAVEEGRASCRGSHAQQQEVARLHPDRRLHPRPSYSRTFRARQLRKLNI